MKTAKALSLIVLTFPLLFIGCKKKQEAEGYRVVSYDAGTHQWVIIRNGTFDGKYLRKRITAICSFYQWGNHPMDEGQDACDLRVGEMLIPNQTGRGREFLDVYEMDPDTLAITQGDSNDPNRVSQQFKILKEEILSDNTK